jgi:hypothetical protein
MFTAPLRGQAGGSSCRIKVNGRYNVLRLRRHLSRFGVQTSAPLQLDGTANYVLRIQGGRRISRFRLRQLLAGFSYVELFM